MIPVTAISSASTPVPVLALLHSSFVIPEIAAFPQSHLLLILQPANPNPPLPPPTGSYYCTPGHVNTTSANGNTAAALGLANLNFTS